MAETETETERERVSGKGEGETNAGSQRQINKHAIRQATTRQRQIH